MIWQTIINNDIPITQACKGGLTLFYVGSSEEAAINIDEVLRMNL